MSLLGDLIFASSSVALLIMVVVANYYQIRIMRRFSGVIGKIMFWYSLGLASMLALTIFEWVVTFAGLDPGIRDAGEQVFFTVAVAFFLRGSIIIR